MWEILENGLLGFIYIIDNRKPETFWYAHSLIEKFMMHALMPYIIAVNHGDHPYAWDVELLRIALQIPALVPIIPCVATDRESVKGVMIALLTEVLKDCETVAQE